MKEKRMHNQKVKLKLFRNLFSLGFWGDDATIQIDDYWNQGIYEDLSPNIKVIVDIFEGIENGYFELSVDSISSIYQRISILIIDIPMNYEVVSSFINKTQQYEWDWKKQFVYIISRNVFYDLSFIMAIIIINIQYFNKNCVFLNINLKSKNSIENKIALGNIHGYMNEFRKIEEYNALYHIPSLYLGNLQDIKKTIKLLPKNIFTDHHVWEVFVYGSHVFGNENNYSDIDFKVVIKKTSDDLDKIAESLRREFSIYFGKKIDLVVVTVNMILSKQMKNIFKDKILIWKLLP